MSDYNLTLLENIGFSGRKGCLCVAILLSLLFISCDDQTVIYPTPGNPVAEFQEEGLHIEFYLLDKEQQPILMMPESENFILCFSICNTHNDTMSLSSEFLNANFFRIYNARSNADQGVPYTGTWCGYESEEDQVLQIASGETKLIRCPWFFNPNLQADFPLCGGDNTTPYLPPGGYYTTIDLTFDYRINNQSYRVGDKQLRIDFEVI